MHHHHHHHLESCGLWFRLLLCFFRSLLSALPFLSPSQISWPFFQLFQAQRHGLTEDYVRVLRVVEPLALATLQHSIAATPHMQHLLGVGLDQAECRGGRYKKEAFQAIQNFSQGRFIIILPLLRGRQYGLL